MTTPRTLDQYIEAMTPHPSSPRFDAIHQDYVLSLVRESWTAAARYVLAPGVTMDCIHRAWERRPVAESSESSFK